MKMMEPVMEERYHALSLHATSIDETKISRMKLISNTQAMFCWSENMEDENGGEKIGEILGGNGV